MIVSYRSLLAKVRDDLSEEEWADLFMTASYIYRTEDKKGKDRDDFYNAMMALPVADLGSIVVETKVQSWEGLHVNPMVPIWIEQRDSHITTIVGKELNQLLHVLMYKFESSTSKLSKKTFDKYEKCFVDSMREHGYKKFSFDRSPSERLGLAQSYDNVIEAALGIMPSYATMEQLIEKTKVIRILFKCFKKPTPPTILSFLFENES